MYNEKFQLILQAALSFGKLFCCRAIFYWVPHLWPYINTNCTFQKDLWKDYSKSKNTFLELLEKSLLSSLSSFAALYCIYRSGYFSQKSKQRLWKSGIDFGFLIGVHRFFIIKDSFGIFHLHNVLHWFPFRLPRVMALYQPALPFLKFCR